MPACPPKPPLPRDRGDARRAALVALAMAFGGVATFAGAPRPGFAQGTPPAAPAPAAMEQAPEELVTLTGSGFAVVLSSHGGAIARLEHAVSGFEEERERQRRRCDEAKSRLASYRSRQGGTFAFAEDLSDKRRQLAEIEKTLAAEVHQ